MKKKKVSLYLAAICSLLALSIITPVLISNGAHFIAGKIGSPRQTESETSSSPGMEEISLGLEAESGQENVKIRAGSAAGENPETKPSAVNDGADLNFYNEPEYASKEEEDAANEKAYKDMKQKLRSKEEAANDYREEFDPVYDELVSGLMSSFISGREQAFYTDLADFCFGRYNTAHHIAMVRFCARTEETNEKETVILELFTDEDLLNDLGIPNLYYCTYNKKTQAFVFFAGAA